MAEDDKIKYSDIIQPDDSIEKLVKQLGELNQQYEVMVNAIRAGADRVVHALKSVSGATSDGRKSIDEATASTSRLERAQNELKLAMSDTGKQIAWLKAQTADANRTTVEQQRYLQQAVSSYDRLKSDLKEAVSLYKSLTDAERADSQMGQQLLNDIINLKNQRKKLIKTPAPRQPFMVRTRRFIIYIVYTGSLKFLTQLTAAHVFLRAHAQEQCVYLAVELAGIGEHTIIHLANVGLRRQEYSTAERSDVRKLVKIGQCCIECLVASPRQAGHSAVIPVGKGAECPVDIWDYVVQQYRSKRSSKLLARLTRLCSMYISAVSIIHDDNHWHTFA